jgi:hypothetical protein
MKTIEQMRVEAHKYMISLDSNSGVIFLMKPKGEVIISPQRARLWVEAGVNDIDCQSTEKILEEINLIEKMQQARNGGK